MRFALTRHISGEKCSSETFRQWWQTNRETAAAAFFNDVFAVALEAIALGFYHWDIRAANLICNMATSQFYILDWESLADANNGCQVDGFFNNLQVTNKLDKLSSCLAVALCHNLLASCIYKWDELETEKTANFTKRLAVNMINQLVIPQEVFGLRLESEHCQQFFREFMRLCISSVRLLEHSNTVFRILFSQMFSCICFVTIAFSLTEASSIQW